MTSILDGGGREVALGAEIRRGAERRFLTAPSPNPGATAPINYSPPPTMPGLPGTAAAPAIPDLGQLLGLVMRGLQGVASIAVPLIGGAMGIYDATLAEPGQSTREISTNELRRILEAGSALVVDSRTALEYAIGHIPGAVNIAPKPNTPMSSYTSDAAEIARLVPSLAMPIVLYCNGPYCGKSRRLGDDLVRAGFTNVSRYQLGTPVWRALVGPMVIEPEGIRHVLHNDRTAAFIDGREPSEFQPAA